MADRRTIRAIHRRLEQRFGPLAPPRSSDPLEELILTVLSQHTSDVNAARAFASLRARFPTWEAVVRARPGVVADAIRSGGLANVKAPRIRSILREIHDREGRYDLSFLREMSDADATRYLSSLNGVGPKTAAIVLAFSLGRNALAVDTHVHRVARRLGLIPPNASAERAHMILEELVPPELRIPMHVGLIRLGREICKAGRPRCEVCPLNDLCPTGRANLGLGERTRRSGRSPRAPAG
ncbi:MAG: endonuclease III domain-containing protein [Actinomycetota bacterium]